MLLPRNRSRATIIITITTMLMTTNTISTVQA